MNEKFEQLSEYEITLIRWKDEWKHWRLGLNWDDFNEYEYIVEMPTIGECLDKAIEYVKHIKNEKI